MALLESKSDRTMLPTGTLIRRSKRSQSPMLLLLLLTAVYITAYMDRQLFALLLPAINKDLGMTDTQIGLLTGLAFPIVYGLSGLVISVAADRLDRIKLITLSTSIFSLMTAACGLAQGFGTLFMARLGTGVGEAGTPPPSFSLIADNFEGPARQFANTVYATAAVFGVLIAYIVMGNISVRLGWRIAFLAAGAVGIVIAIGTFAFLSDTERRNSQSLRLSDFRDFSAIFRISSFRWVMAAAVFHTILTEANIQWLPLFLSRSLHMNQEMIAWFLGLNYSILGLLGIIVGGVIATRLRRRSIGAPQLLCCGVAAATALSYATAYLSRDILVSQIMLCLVIFLSISAFGAMLAFMQDVTPSGDRAKATAALLILSQIGLGLGSLFIGILSDSLVPILGQESLRYALLPVVLVSGLVASFCYFMASRTGERDVAVSSVSVITGLSEK